MPGFADFDDSVAIKRACRTLELSADKCRILGSVIAEACGSKITRKGKVKRARSPWQECIGSRRKGKPFDPQAIKALAKEYRAGTCPP